jgi:hypothetical protein
MEDSDMDHFPEQRHGGPRVFTAAFARCRPAASQPKLLDPLRDAVRVRHYSLRTEEAYVAWARRFILFHHKRHPMGAAGKYADWRPDRLTGAA